VDDPIEFLPYTVDLLGTISTQVHGYQGEAAIARELVQNADDAGSSWIEFVFQQDGLRARNGSVFSEDDFNSIRRIAVGHRRQDSTTTGAWGTGFLSVYQITDHPELHSSGKHLRFNPLEDRIPVTRSSVNDHTEFYLPWRTSSSVISDRLKVGTWTPEKIAAMQHTIAVESYRVLPFLRNVQHIKILIDEAGEQRVSHEVCRTRQRSRDLPGQAVLEHWRFDATDHEGGTARDDDWLILRGMLPSGFQDRGRTIKSPEIAIGICPTITWLGELLPGVLYNYLPTPIDTGFGFHLQGDFFPDANRLSIDTGNTEYGNWNRHVLSGIARLFCDHLILLRDELVQTADSSAQRFYRLLPATTTASLQPLSVIVDTFRQRARTIPIIRTTDGAWTAPKDVRMPGPRLWQITRDHLERIVPGFEPSLSPMMMTLISDLGGTPFRLPELMSELNRTVRPDTPLAEAAPIINSREKLDAIVEFIRLRLDRPTEQLSKQ